MNGGAVLVTGAAGRIGRAVSRRLLDAGYHVFGVERPGGSGVAEGVIPLPADLSGSDASAGVLRRLRDEAGSHLAAVVHLAAFYDFTGRPSPLYESLNVGATVRLLRGLNRQGFDVGRFVFASTLHVHAPGRPGERLTEDSPLGPTWAYPASKLAAEEAVTRERGAVPAVRLRIAGVYDDGCHSLPLSHQIRRVHARALSAHFYPANPFHGQAYVHLEDVTDAIARCIERSAGLPPDVPLLLGEPYAPAYQTLQARLSRLLHGEYWTPVRVPAWAARVGAWAREIAPATVIPLLGDDFLHPWMIDRAGDHYAVDCSRARDLLGWSPRRRLLDTLPLMVTALRRDPAAFYAEHDLGEPPR